VAWFKKFIELPNGIPSHDTLSRVFSALDPQELQSSSMKWIRKIGQFIPENIIVDFLSKYRLSSRTKAQQR
jgi:hypothetical protein